MKLMTKEIEETTRDRYMTVQGQRMYLSLLNTLHLIAHGLGMSLRVTRKVTIGDSLDGLMVTTLSLDTSCCLTWKVYEVV